MLAEKPRPRYCSSCVTTHYGKVGNETAMVTRRTILGEYVLCPVCDLGPALPDSEPNGSTPGPQ
jgi:hypothetical protein